MNFGTDPKIAIGQRALIVRTPHGNVMWDCVRYVDDASVEALREIGGLSAIAISHPHFYSAMTTWSAAFGDCPVYIHAGGPRMGPVPRAGLRLWDGDALEILPGVTLIKTGGHFEGAQVLHWAAGADGRGRAADRRLDHRRAGPPLGQLHVQLPEPDPDHRRRGAPHRRGAPPYPYERIYSAWEGGVTATDGVRTGTICGAVISRIGRARRQACRAYLLHRTHLSTGKPIGLYRGTRRAGRSMPKAARMIGTAAGGGGGASRPDGRGTVGKPGSATRKVRAPRRRVAGNTRPPRGEDQRHSDESTATA